MVPLHFSVLKRISLSPAHAFHALNQPESEETVSLRLGSAGHTLALGTGKRVVVYEGKRDKRTHAYKAFLEENPDAIILNAREHAVANGMAKGLKRNRDAMRFLEGEREVQREWEWLGRRCATRGIDVIGHDFITELKTTKCAKPEWFVNEVLRRCYHAQLGFYEPACRITSPEHVIVAVESAAPFESVVYRLTDNMRDLAQRLLRTWMELWLTCERSDHWPGYAQGVIDLDAPGETELDLSDVEEVDDAVGLKGKEVMSAFVEAQKTATKLRNLA